MTTLHKNISQLIGVDFNANTATATFPVGTLAESDLGGKFEYVLFSDVAATGQAFIIDEAGAAVAATLTTSATALGDRVGIAPATVTDEYYGWLQIYGPCAAIQVTASAAANVVLNTTATAGQLNDDATAGAEVINGLVLTTARGGTDGTAAGVLNFPTIGATL